MASLTTARFALNADMQVRHLAIYLHELCVTSGDCELSRFAFSCIRSVVYLNALNPYYGLFNHQSKLVIIYKPGKDEKLSWPD